MTDEELRAELHKFPGAGLAWTAMELEAELSAIREQLDQAEFEVKLIVSRRDACVKRILEVGAEMARRHAARLKAEATE